METGIKKETIYTVEDKATAKNVGSGELEVLATPYLVALMEETAWKSVQSSLNDGESTVGSYMEIKHISPTPVGVTVKIHSELVGIDRKKLTFKITAEDVAGPIAEAVHERFIVNAERFTAKAVAKQ